MWKHVFKPEKNRIQRIALELHSLWNVSTFSASTRMTWTGEILLFTVRQKVCRLKYWREMLPVLLRLIPNSVLFYIISQKLETLSFSYVPQWIQKGLTLVFILCNIKGIWTQHWLRYRCSLYLKKSALIQNYLSPNRWLWSLQYPILLSRNVRSSM